uniref:Uncharacterized protein n=1 Tax=Panagrellus redivivus TaxID=6233 RepID=A0A7E4UN73_PANRE
MTQKRYTLTSLPPSASSGCSAEPQQHISTYLSSVPWKLLHVLDQTHAVNAPLCPTYLSLTQALHRFSTYSCTCGLYPGCAWAALCKKSSNDFFDCYVAQLKC